MHRPLIGCALAALFAAGCAGASAEPGEPAPGEDARTSDVDVDFSRHDAFPSTYEPLPSQPTLIRNATVMTAAGSILRNASVLMRDGEIAAVGQNVEAPADATVVDATGKWVTPGIIDTHSHLGVYAAPGGESLSDGNEATSPNTAEVWAEHSVWPQDPQFGLALAGGVTTLHILPGSANLFGGRGVTLRNLAGRTVQSMKYPGAPYSVKMACGENPKRVYGDRGGPSTRMGNVAGYRAAWIDAQEYKEDWEEWARNGRDENEKPTRDLEDETLAGVLDGEILVQNHCYRADEMVVMMDIADEFGYDIASFHHAVESYKIRDILRENEVCSSMWSDWWGFKLEAYDGIRANIALVDDAGACAILHTDDAQGIQRMNQDAAKALAAGLQAGLDLGYEDAIQWITINPAKALGIEEEVGSLEEGKRADVVIWDGDPFSVYTHAEHVYMDGALVYERGNPELRPVSDFMLGNITQGAR